MSDLTNDFTKVQRLVGVAQTAHQRWEVEKEYALEAVDVAEQELAQADDSVTAAKTLEFTRTLQAMKNDLQRC